MTTTREALIRKITSLRDLSRNAGTPAEAETALMMAKKLCVKHDIDQAILTEAPKQMRKPFIDGSKPQEKKYSCRFGCGYFVKHTIDELNACAAKAREASATGSAYDAPKGNPFGGSAFWDWTTTDSSSRSSDSTYTDSRGRTKTHQARSTGSHAYCSHEATKSARAKCRRERGY